MNVSPTGAALDVEVLNTRSLAEVAAAFVGTGLPRRLLELARDEDLGAARCDVTSEATVSSPETLRTDVTFRECGVVAGLAFLPLLADVYDAAVTVETVVGDGEIAEPGQTVCVVTGARANVLAIERPLLNLVGRLSGIATLTRRFVDAVQPHAAHILDTRKTTPGLRLFEKYAVRCGGGLNHRLSLTDAVLVKDNHIAHVAPAELGAFIRDAIGEQREGLSFVQVEVDTLAQFEALLADAADVVDIVLLDNMDPDTLRDAVVMRDAHESAVRLEASGGVSLTTVGAIAATGVDRISIGALTHGARSLDVGLDLS